MEVRFVWTQGPQGPQLGCYPSAGERRWVVGVKSRPARGLRQDISGNNAVVVRKRECSHMATASSAARISGGCKVCNLE